jgi:hypothetical protein
MHAHGGAVAVDCASAQCCDLKYWEGSLRHLPAGARDRSMDACQK